ncbi:MAG: phenylalanine--tRNA ligase subunit beta [Nitrospirota bacterium]
MPTISVKKRDIELLSGEDMSIERISTLLSLVKGEIKEVDEEEIKIELSDTNRPDLWCSEGIARQLRYKIKGGDIPLYPFYDSDNRKGHEVIVSDGVRRVRPYIAACIAKGVSIDNDALKDIIQTQEKLSENFGRKRTTVSIGIYRLEKISFPVYYKTVDPDTLSFIPLGFDKEMTMREILNQHPKGKSYGYILSEQNGKDDYPILMDNDGKVLSFPPIINSREIGEVRVGDKELFVEITGTDLRLLMLALNILATNLYDRGGEITPVHVNFPYDTEYGRSVRLPYNLSKPVAVQLSDVKVVLGESLTIDEVYRVLKEYGYKVRKSKDMIEATPPPYRDDIMHPIDIIEDIAISKGYESFVPILPSRFTVGSLSEIEVISDKVREYMIGLGFQEIISNILSPETEIRDKMCLDGSESKVIEVDNAMSESYGVVRDWIIPSLLRVEHISSRSFYPHNIFEVGETVEYDKSEKETATRTLIKLGTLLSHNRANFSELHSSLDMLLYYLGIGYKLQPFHHPSFIEGRSGKIVWRDNIKGSQDIEIGIIGELHPQVLENWKIDIPCTAFELYIDRLIL